MAEDRSQPSPAVVDYDSGFDYPGFWDNRGYERWVEDRVLRRLLRRLPRAQWFADFGGGFGRNAAHYRQVAPRVLLVDYSVTNLSQAAERLRDQIARGQVFLVRSDLAHLPLVAGAVETAMVVRVLHHLTEPEAALAEMARSVGRAWLLDVPIKHHLLARLRAARSRGQGQLLRSPAPLVTGSTAYPFYTFQLGWIRRRLAAAGFSSEVSASVNNFRRWDQLLPARAVPLLRPLVYPSELALQRLGRGWWGPSQFLLARRSTPLRPQLHDLASAASAPLRELSRRLCCPSCRGGLVWRPDRAACPGCQVEYPRQDAFWDFTPRSRAEASQAE